MTELNDPSGLICTCPMVSWSTSLSVPEGTQFAGVSWETFKMVLPPGATENER